MRELPETREDAPLRPFDCAEGSADRIEVRDQHADSDRIAAAAYLAKTAKTSHNISYPTFVGAAEHAALRDRCDWKPAGYLMGAHRRIGLACLPACPGYGSLCGTQNWFPGLPMRKHAPLEPRALTQISPLWAVAWIVLLPLVFPPVLIFYAGMAAGVVQGQPLIFGGFFVFFVSLFHVVDRDIRGRINDNVSRVRSVLAARAAAAEGDEPVALLLHSFSDQTAYRDELFSLYERVDPALRSLGLRPLAFGTALPLAPDHGVALIATSDAEWWEKFRLAARHAAVIVISPEATESLQREICWIASEEMTAKLVVLMAPEPLEVMRETGDPHTSFADASGPKDRRVASWRKARRFWRTQTGVDLPEYDPRGAVILLPDRGGAVWSRPARGFAREPGLRRAMRLVIGMVTGDYKTGSGVALNDVVQDAFAEREWTGPPVSDLWQQLAPQELEIDARSYLHPPGANVKVGQLSVGIALVGWSMVLLFGLIAVIT